MSTTSSQNDIPRVALNTIGDWERIKKDLETAARESLDAVLVDKEPISDQDKELLMKHLLQWHTDSFELAKANVTVNGQDLENYVPEPEETEPFDELLVRRRQALTEEQLVWDKTLADRRRKAPREVERVMEDLLMRQRMAIPIAPPAEPVPPLELPEIPRWEEIAEVHGDIATLAGTLTEKLPSVASQAQKARRVDQAIASLSSQ